MPAAIVASPPDPAYSAVPADIAAPWAPSPTFAVPQSAAEFASVDYEPMGRTWTRPSATRAPVPERAGTAGAWMLALSPIALVALIVVIGVIALGGSASDASAIIAERNVAVLGVSSLAVVAVSLVYVVIAVVIDRRRLIALGFTHRPSPAWILLGPLIYLIVRTVRVLRESGRGTAPLWVFLILSVTIGAASVAAPFLVPRDASLATMRAVESQISADLEGTEGVDTVICPDRTDARIGSNFSCEARDADGSVIGIVSARWTSADGGVEYDVIFGSN